MTATSDLVTALRRANDAEQKLARIAELMKDETMGDHLFAHHVIQIVTGRE